MDLLEMTGAPWSMDSDLVDVGSGNNYTEKFPEDHLPILHAT